MSKLIAKIVIDLDEYNHLKFVASKLAESEKIIKENLKIKPEENIPLYCQCLGISMSAHERSNLRRSAILRCHRLPNLQRSAILRE